MDSAVEIVVGIDFGTTYSGVSWAVNAGPKTIRLIQTWPDPKSAHPTVDKVPTKLSYHPNGKVDKWGAYCGDDALKWFKILLEPEEHYAKAVNDVLKTKNLMRTLQKSAVEITADYLFCLWEFTKNDIRKHQGDDFENSYSIKIVLSVPAMWTPAAKDKTMQAAREAGFPRDAKIELVAEPECAALAALKERADIGNLQVGDAIVVCDAGGGTVDLISYKIDGLHPLQIKECAIGDGGLCGSVFVDIGFEKWIITITGQEQYNSIRPKFKDSMMRDFDNQIKRQFTSDVNQRFGLELRGVENNPKVVDDIISVNFDALSTIFDHVCLQIENLVGKQIQEVQQRHALPVKAILLVGGFGSSTYLYDRLKNCHKTEGIQVFQVPGAWSAICRGATMWGLEHSQDSRRPSMENHKTVVSRLARYSYGLAFHVPFDHTKHLWHERIEDPASGRLLARNQMEWLLRRGEEITEGRILPTICQGSVQVGFRDGGTRDFEQTLYYSKEDEPPPRVTEDVKKLCSVEWSIQCNKLWVEPSVKHPVTREKWRHPEFLMTIICGSVTLDFVITYRRQPVAWVEAKYLEQF